MDRRQNCYEIVTRAWYIIVMVISCDIKGYQNETIEYKWVGDVRQQLFSRGGRKGQRNQFIYERHLAIYEFNEFLLLAFAILIHNQGPM